MWVKAVAVAPNDLQAGAPASAPGSNTYDGAPWSSRTGNIRTLAESRQGKIEVHWGAQLYLWFCRHHCIALDIYGKLNGKEH